MFALVRLSGDRLFEKKEMMRELYLNFLDEPADSLRRTQEGGIYTSYYIGETKSVKLILLDTRYSKDTYWREYVDILGNKMIGNS